MTTTHVTNIAHLLDLTAYAGDFIDDYDMDAVNADYLAAVNDEILLDGVVVCGNGDVIAPVDSADDARSIDWEMVTGHIKVQAIFERHDVTTRINKTYDADGFGKVVREGHDADGNLIAAWGPDTRDENGAVVDELDDQYWIATRYDNGNPIATETGTKAEIEKLARGWMKTR